MLLTDLRLAFRYLTKHKGISFLNLAGLTVGMAACLLIALYVYDGQSYERFHEHADRLVRVTLEVINQGQAEHYAVTVPALGPTLQREMPEVEAFVRIAPGGGAIQRGTTLFKPERLYHADSTFFEVFSYPLLRGNPETALTRPFTVVLSEGMAKRFFGTEDPLGQTLTIAGRDCEVTGLLKNPPANSHLQPEVVLSLTTLTARVNRFNDDNWWMRGNYTYLLLRTPSDAQAFAEKLPAFTETHFADIGQQWNASFRLHVQPVTAIHLHSQLLQEVQPNGNVVHVYIFSAAALLVLLMACINFVNLRTARSAQRAREVGVRKVVGAQHHQLMRQFLSESLVLSLASLVLALGLVALVLPAFNALAEKTMTLGALVQGPALLVAAGLALVVGLLAGAYPAFFLAGMQPIHVLKGQTSLHMRGRLLRKGLVVLQFSLALVLLVGTIVIFNQLAYIQQTDLGYEREQRIVLPNHPTMRSQYAPETVKQALVQHPHIERVAAGTYVPTNMLPGNVLLVPEGREEAHGVTLVNIDDQYVPTLGLEVVAGRNLSAARASDSTAFLINEAAAQRFGWAEPLGKTLSPLNDPLSRGEVVGVIKNFHTGSLHDAIEPVVLAFSEARRLRRYIVQTKANDETLAFLEAQWAMFAPSEPFEYTFLDAEYDALYRAEARLNHVATLFSALTLFVAALGLLGLMAFIAVQRTKEIGIRKVLGATIPEVFFLLVRQFLMLFGIACVVALPVAYYVMDAWLGSFAYRITLDAGPFLFAGGFLVVLMVLTISKHALQAARMNPVDSLRYE